MKTLFLAWQDAVKTRSWYPIGRLDTDEEGRKYSFTYLRGAEIAQREADMKPLESFPDFYRKYEAEKLFPIFQNRLIPSTREDYREYIDWLDLNPDSADAMDILAVSEGCRLTDNLEVFPLISPDKDRNFKCRFFLHGWRHVCDCARDKIMALAHGQPLRVSIEINNPVTGLAIQLSTEDYHMVGWAPRYLIVDLVRLVNEGYRMIQARIVKVNPEPAPSQQRILIEIAGRWPKDIEPMSSEEFKELNASSIS